jgi:ribokinase
LSFEKRTVLTVGGGLIDTIAVIHSDDIERMSLINSQRAFLLLEEGRKTEAELISTHAGGGGVNTAVAFRRLGHVVQPLLKIGSDDRGRTLIDVLKREGIDTGAIVRTEKAATGASVIVSSHERNAAIFTYRGANALLKEDDVDWSLATKDIVYIASLSDQSADLFPKLVSEAAKRRAFVVANPGIRQLSSRDEALRKALPKLSVLSVNRFEAGALVPKLQTRMTAKRRRKRVPDNSPALLRVGLSGGDYTMGLMAFAEVLLESGLECLLVTDGHDGAYAAEAGVLTYCPVLPTEVVGTTGAGDAFSATFVAFKSAGVATTKALQLATLNAASVLGYADSQSGLLRFSELEQFAGIYAERLKTETWRLG